VGLFKTGRHCFVLDLNAVSIFLSVADCVSFSEAARRLNISQPSVSQTIKALEKKFGVQLFIRQGRSIRLTDAGRLLQSKGRELLANSSHLEEAMHALKREPVGEVNLGCSTASAKYFLPHWVARFRQNFPQVRVNFLIYKHDQLRRMLIDGQIPIVVSGKRIDHADVESQPLMTEEIVLIVPAAHRWAEDGRIYPQELLQESLVLPEKGSMTLELLLHSLHQHQISSDMLQTTMTLGDLEAVVMGVEAGIGVAFVPRLVATRSLSSGKVVQVEVQGMSLSREIHLARSRRFPPTRAQAEFWCFAETQRLPG
jgi:DNA-binding transcriptional LysR family regulator